MYVHFADNSNDFGWFLYFSSSLWDAEPEESENLPWVVTSVGEEEDIYKCRSQVRWFYYNGERGERLWPLDSKTWSGLDWMSWLNMTWWIYTLCAQSGYQEALKDCEHDSSQDYNQCIYEARLTYNADGYGYYWTVEQEMDDWSQYVLTVGVNYNTGTRLISIDPESKLAPTFVRIGNKYPVWFVYDNHWSLGLAWCRFTERDSNSMKDLVEEVKEKQLGGVFFYSTASGHLVYSGNISWTIVCDNISLADRLSKIVIEGIMWLSDNWEEWDTKFWMIGNSSDTKTQYFATKSVTNVSMMNYARRRAELLCRGKWIGDGDDPGDNDIVCRAGGDISTDQSEELRNRWQTLIVKNANVTISPMSGFYDETYYDIFILSGNLLIDEEDAQKFVVDNKGFVKNVNVLCFRMRNFLKITGLTSSAYVSQIQDYYLNGIGNLELWMDLDGNAEVNADDFDIAFQCASSIPIWDWASVASIIKGNFIVNWQVKAVNEGDTLKNKYFLYGKFTTRDTISSLEDMFAWRCDNEAGSDGNFCPRSDGNSYWNASLVVIDQNYQSPLLQS